MSTVEARLTGYRSFLALLGRAEVILACVLVFFMITAIAAEVFFRYVLASSLLWVEEAAMICFIWITFLGAAVAAKAQRHIKIETIGAHLSGSRAHSYWLGGGTALVLALAVLVAYFSYGYTSIQARTLTVSLPVNVPRSWMFAWPLFVGMCSIALTYLYYLLDIVIQMFRHKEASMPRPVLEL